MRNFFTTFLLVCHSIPDSYYCCHYFSTKYTKSEKRMISKSADPHKYIIRGQFHTAFIPILCHTRQCLIVSHMSSLSALIVFAECKTRLHIFGIGQCYFTVEAPKNCQVSQVRDAEISFINYIPCSL